MAYSIRRSRLSILIAAVLLCVAADSANGQGATRKIRPAEQALVDRIAGEFSKILPPLPAGWVEVERNVFDPNGTVADMDPAPISMEFEWRISVADLAVREQIVQKRLEAQVDRDRIRLEAAAATNQKMVDDYAARIEAAIKRNDQAGLKRLQQEFEKKMADGAKEAEPAKAAAPELSDTYARIRISINPYNAPSVASEKPLATPPGFIAALRREPNENRLDDEGVALYLLGNWQSQSGDWTLKFAPGQTAAVYGIVLEIEARADRADALFLAMSRVRLQALLK